MNSPFEIVSGAVWLYLAIMTAVDGAFHGRLTVMVHLRTFAAGMLAVLAVVKANMPADVDLPWLSYLKVGLLVFVGIGYFQMSRSQRRSR